MRKATKIGFIGVFCAVIGLAFPIFNIFSKQLSMDSHENRLMTGLPQVLHSPLRELPRNLDNFLVDNSPFRYQFVLVNAGLDYALFGTSQSDQVLPGKKGWLFLKLVPRGLRSANPDRARTMRFCTCKVSMSSMEGSGGPRKYFSATSSRSPLTTTCKLGATTDSSAPG